MFWMLTRHWFISSTTWCHISNTSAIFAQLITVWRLNDIAARLFAFFCIHFLWISFQTHTVLSEASSRKTCDCPKSSVYTEIDTWSYLNTFSISLLFLEQACFVSHKFRLVWFDTLTCMNVSIGWYSLSVDCTLCFVEYQHVFFCAIHETHQISVIISVNHKQLTLHPLDLIFYLFDSEKYLGSLLGQMVAERNNTWILKGINMLWVVETSRPFSQTSI